MEKIQRYRGLIIFFLSAIVLFFLSYRIPFQAIRPMIAHTGPAAPIAWIVVTLVAYIIPPVTRTPLLLIGYYLFGTFVIWYSLVVGFFGAIINFWIARKWGRKFLRYFVDEQGIKKFDKYAEQQGTLTLLLVRIFLSDIHDTISYAAGLTDIPFGRYLFITVIAFIPGTIIWYYATRFTTNPLFFTGITLGISSLFFCCYVIGRKILHWDK